MRRYGSSPSTRGAKVHDLLIEGVELALKKRGNPALADMKTKVAAEGTLTLCARVEGYRLSSIQIFI
jgi:hypothetical protein